MKISGKTEKYYVIHLEYKYIKEIKQDKEYLTIKIDEEMGKKLFG